MFSTTYKLTSILLLILPSYANPIIKSDYVIGGWIPDLPGNFLSQWSPIFEDHLNALVGNSYNPPVRFHLVPVDFSTQNRAIDLITAGKLDFVCEWKYAISCL